MLLLILNFKLHRLVQWGMTYPCGIPTQFLQVTIVEHLEETSISENTNKVISKAFKPFSYL